MTYANEMHSHFSDSCVCKLSDDVHIPKVVLHQWNKSHGDWIWSVSRAFHFSQSMALFQWSVCSPKTSMEISLYVPDPHQNRPFTHQIELLGIKYQFITQTCFTCQVLSKAASQIFPAFEIWLLLVLQKHLNSQYNRSHLCAIRSVLSDQWIKVSENMLNLWLSYSHTCARVFLFHLQIAPQFVIVSLPGMHLSTA